MPRNGNTMDAQNEAPQAGRLNPFLLPSETSMRFVLLIVLTLSGALTIYSWIYSASGLNDGYVRELRRCGVIGRDGVPEQGDLLRAVLDGTVTPDMRKRLEEESARTACMYPYTSARGLTIIGMVAGLLAVSGAVFVLTPWVIARRGHLVALNRTDAQEAHDALEAMRAESGAGPVTYLWNPLAVTATGRAFGFPGRKIIGFSGGMIALHYTAPAAFRAAALHEFAHIRNADVSLTFFASALWQAFVAVAVVPYAISLLPELSSVDGRTFVPFSLAQVCILTLLVYASRNGLLRQRELYADARVATFPGAAQALHEMINGLAQRPAGRFARVFETHPSVARRLRTLIDGADLFIASTSGVFLSGVAAGIAFGGWTLVFADLGSSNSWTVTFLMGLISAGLALGVVLLMIWRAMFGAMFGGLHRPAAGRIGWTLALGLACGNVLSVQQLLSIETGSWLINPLVVLLVSGPLMHGLARWVQRGSGAWLGAMRSAGDLRVGAFLVTGGMLPAALSCLVPVITLLSLGLPGLLPLLFLAVVPDFYASLGLFPTRVSALLSFAVIISVWAIPLAGVWWRSRQERTLERGWAYLGTPPNLPVQASGAFGVGTTLRIGLIGGVCLSILPVVVRILTVANSAAPSLLTPREAQTLMDRLVWVNALAQLPLAIWAAWRAESLRTAHGLLAAFACALVMTLTVVIHNLARGNSFDFEFVWLILWQSVNRGALLAIPFLALLGRLARDRSRCFNT